MGTLAELAVPCSEARMSSPPAKAAAAIYFFLIEHLLQFEFANQTQGATSWLPRLKLAGSRFRDRIGVTRQSKVLPKWLGEVCARAARESAL